MAIYHAHFGIIRRSNGQSAIASSAYRSGKKLYDEREYKTHDYRRKKGVIYHEVMLCKNAPNQWNDEEKLWNEVEASEKSEKAQLAREANFALPKELDEKQQIELARDYVQRSFVDRGMCVQLDIHNPHGNQPHFHVMLTMRAVDENGKFLPKSRTEFVLDDQGNRIPIINPQTGKQKINKKKRGERQWRRVTVSTTNWNDQETLRAWRRDWAVSVNRALENANIRDADGNYVTVSEKSLKDQGINRLPTIHEGVAARAMEKRGIRTERGEINRQIQADNAALEQQQALEAERQSIQEKEDELTAQAKKLQDELDEVNRALAANMKAIQLREAEQAEKDAWVQWIEEQEVQEKSQNEVEKETSRLAAEEEARNLLEYWMTSQEDTEVPAKTRHTPLASESWKDVFHFGNGEEQLQKLRDIAHAGEQPVAESPSKSESHSGYYARTEDEYRKEHPVAVAEKRIQQPSPTKDGPKTENTRCIDQKITPAKAMPENYNKTYQKITDTNEEHKQRDVRQQQAAVPKPSAKETERLQRPAPPIHKQPQNGAKAVPEIHAEPVEESPKRPAPEKKKRHLITKRRDSRGHGMGR